MKQKAKKFLNHPLISGTIILVLGSLLANFVNFLFNFYMLRNLSPVDYGTLASIMALITLPLVGANAVQPLIVYFAGTFFAKNELDKIRGLYMKISRFYIFIAIVIFFLFLIFTPQISHFFRINDLYILLITYIIIFFTILIVVNNAFLQAKMAFKFIIFVGFISALIKMASGIIFVTSGFAALGAIIAVLLATVIPYLITFIPIKFIFSKKIKIPKIETKSLYTYGIPSVLTFLGLNSLISSDIILAKHFFDPKSAGIYAGLSLIGKIIFYVSSPITNVMFPIVVQKHSRNENFTNTFLLSLLLVILPSIPLLIVYAFFPQLVITIFFKKEYLSISPLVLIFGLFLTIFAPLSLISNFYLSIKKTKIFIPIIIGAMIQIVLISIYHESFIQLIVISMTITLLLLIGLLIYYPFATRKGV